MISLQDQHTGKKKTHLLREAKNPVLLPDSKPLPDTTNLIK